MKSYCLLGKIRDQEVYFDSYNLQTRGQQINSVYEAKLMYGMH